MTERRDGRDHQVEQNSQTNPTTQAIMKEELGTPPPVSTESHSDIYTPNQQCYEPAKQEDGREAHATSPVTSIDHRNCTGTERQQRDVVVYGQAVQNARTTIPTEWAVSLDHIVADLRISKAQAVRDAIGLYLRYHNRGLGIPEPLPPIGRQ